MSHNRSTPDYGNNIAVNMVVKSVTILHALRWVAEAWKNVNELTIKKCFRKAGILEKDITVVQLHVLSQRDPFTDFDDSADGSDTEDELLHLMNAVQGSDGACTLHARNDEAENEVSICSEFADTRDEQFMAELQPNSSEARVITDEDECKQDAPEPPAKRVKNYKEAVECL